jgi:hypothetical protein
MPIRFRCPSCTKLLGIARRKAGTVVHCPTCGVEVTVPTEAETRQPARPAIDRREPAQAAHASNGHGTRTPESMPLFERPDFESLLNPVVMKARPEEPPRPEPVPVRDRPKPPPPPRALIPVDDGYDVEPVGLVISRGNLTIAAVVVVVLIGLSFAAGYLLAAARLPAAG